MFVLPCELDELIELTPAIVANCFSSGSATADAIVSGLAPGRPALTWMVGKSTFGRSLTGSSRYAMTPKMTIASMISVVVTGRLMKRDGEIHGCHLWLPVFTLTRLPAIRRSWPSVTTVSPAFSPVLMTVSVGRRRARP